ncbi:MDR family oxidoreductase [Sulfitobacter aestuariivivens]|uniref:MDR family oxidoreductase n=1 Tax=Sulfitobacter aestuariivivens TaxID=2766981 RepID=UPI00361494BA
MGFNALLVRKDDEGKTSAAVEQITEDQLPDGDVTVAVEYSTVNYKDGLCLGPGGGLVRNYPHVPGIDFAGTVEASNDDRYAPGDKVVLTGWRVGEAHWGGYAQKARVKADWLVPLPEGLDTRLAMAVGTAGFTAMLAVMALEYHGIKGGPVLVTGAAGGVGSVAVAILSALGHEVAGVTGRPETADYLKSLGASQIVAREDINETTKRPLEGETWGMCGCGWRADAGACSGTDGIRRLCRCRWSRGGAGLPATVIPFLLRGVNLLGIDSVMQPYENRLRAWERISQDLPMDKLEAMVQPATLTDLPKLGADILKGQVKGRVVVDVNA